jgi:Relaxase/Mobilisation nuclease domain
MVAKVISGQDINGALNYNEQKVVKGAAQCILASGFMSELDTLNFYQKLSRFTDLNERNQRSKTNTLHISLNFDPTENHSREKLGAIATAYMDKIGFGEQPYLVYEHTDAGHPHMHIVTTTIQQNGRRIPIHNIGKNQSEAARKEIEQEFGLVLAEAKKKTEALKPVDVVKAIYGKSETKRSISNIVRAVTRSYKYTSLPELNAILRQYNVTADRGSEHSQMFLKNGLVYSLTDEKGKRIGIPIKASAIHGKPTLAHLEKQFKLNEALRQPFRDKVREKVDLIMSWKSSTTPEKFSDQLHKFGVSVTFRKNAQGRTYGVTFVDNRFRVVFNGSDLGKPYSASAILETLSAKHDTIKPFVPLVHDESESKPDHFITDVLLNVALSESTFAQLPLSVRNQKKRRKKRRS